ncbi:hypothetical protein HYH03_001216 [Edaphochlamys debaryana]|uniref:Uncharacterized protein n=1 Tax=Edaphochlamys debaryana TaxID=47281 RepID=A0A836C6R4_9CHLO|nr:hypothetical protein HYH03_001216 [Edaphochlamys debaryana]|eukprot:KAG2501433.1 hypothetical protein HYH03_001216 [Edaphochlamys debaryana]
MTRVRLQQAVVLLAALAAFFLPAQGRRSGPLHDFNCQKVAFYKTHKTGSTTLGGVMFRAAVEQNMSIYQTDKAHYITVGYKEATHLLGRVDMVLRHIRFSEASTWHANTRSFYARALGTSDYGFVTVLRHPVDRYISDFYYYTEPEARRRGKPVSLAQWAAEGRGGNRMASEFSVRNEIGANEFVASEMMTDGLYLPVELLDYGLAMLAGACGWGLSQVLYLSVNSNSGGERYGHVKLQSRPDMETLALEDPTLLSRISKLNDLDSVLYGAAQASMLARLAPTGPDGGAAASALASAATRLTAARKRLEAECRDVITAPNGSTASASGSGSDGLSASELTGLCTWFSLTDSTYERLPSEDTGYVMPDTAVPAHGDPPPTSWPLSQVLASVKKHLVRYEDPGVKYYHSVLSVRVAVPTAAQASYIYGVSAPMAAPRRARSAAEASRVAAEAEMRAMASSGGGGGSSGGAMDAAEMQAGTAATIPAATTPAAVTAGAATSASAASGAVGGGAEGGAAAAASARHASQHRRRLAEGSASSGAQRSSSRSLPPLDAAGAAAALSAAVRLWAAHHAGEGVHHLAFCVDGLDPDQRDLVTKAAAAGIQDSDAASYTSYEVIECGPPTTPKAAAGLSGAGSSSAATPTAATDGGTEGDGTAETDYGDDYEDDDEDVDAASQPQEAVPKEEEVDKEVAAAKAFLAEQLADSSPLGQLSLRARWYASVHDLQHLLHGNRGTVRSVLLSYEATLPQAGRVCAPVLPWQAAPFGVPLFHDLTKEEQAAERLLEEASGGGAATSTSGGTQEREQWPGPGPGDREPRLRGGAWDQVEGGIGRGHAGPGRGHVGPGTGPGQGLGPMGGRRFRRRRRHRRMGSVPEDWGEAGLAGGAVQHGQWPAFGGGGGGGTGGGGAAAFAGGSGGIGRRAAAEAGAGATAAEAEAGRSLLSSSSTEGGGAGTAQAPYAACVRQPCKLEKKGMYHCVMLKSMPHLRRTKVYNSVGKPLPLGRASYKQSYKSPEGQRLEVVHLLPPSKDDLRLESRLAGAQPIKCTNLPLPRLLVPWCPRS